MKSRNFEFLREDHRELADLGGFAEAYVHSDPAACLVKLRTFAEFLVKAIFYHHRLELTYQSNLNDLLADHTFKSITPPVVQDKLHLIRIKGNHAAHGTLHPTTSAQMTGILKEAFDLAQWFALLTGLLRRDELPSWQGPLALTGDSKSQLQREKKAALQKLAEQEALMAKLFADLEEARSQAEAAHTTPAEKAVLLNQALQAASALDFSEQETRFKLIDELLIKAGWNVGSRGKNTEEVGQEMDVLHQPVASSKGRADYVLWDPDNGLPLGVLESKKTAEDAAKGKMQAKYYADGLEKEHGQRPVIFYTNGYEIFIWDDAKGEPPRAIFGFYSLDSLRYCIFQRNQREESLGALFPKEAIIDRLYQIECVKRTCENFDKRRREALLIQATGTGKTRVAVALSELMIRAKWPPDCCGPKRVSARFDTRRIFPGWRPRWRSPLHPRLRLAPSPRLALRPPARRNSNLVTQPPNDQSPSNQPPPVLTICGTSPGHSLSASRLVADCAVGNSGEIGQCESGRSCCRNVHR